MRVLIIEDEQLGLDRLKSQIGKIDASIIIAGEADSISSSIAWLQENELPDLIFMDIELSDGQSFEIFKQIEIKVPVVFTTSYDEYALKAFKVNSIDYLLKPIKLEDLRNAIGKWQQIYSKPVKPIDIDSLISGLILNSTSKEYRSRFLVKQGQKFISVETSAIAYFYAEERLCFIRTIDNKRYSADYTMEEIETMLDPKIFFRLNRAFIAHVKAIYQVHIHFSNKLKIDLAPQFDKEVLVSREKATEFKEWLGK